MSGRNRHYWSFQQNQSHPKVAEQNIQILTNLAAGLIAFERYHCTTHGEKQPVFRLLSMVNAAIEEEIQIITEAFSDGELVHNQSKDKANQIPF